jgi:hypothetical protein
MENTIFALRGSPTDIVEKVDANRPPSSANPLQCLTENEALLDRNDRSNSPRNLDNRSNSPRNLDIKSKRTLDESNTSTSINSASSNEKSSLKRSIDRCNSDASLNMSWSPQHKCERSGDSNDSTIGKDISSVFDSHINGLLHEHISGVSPVHVDNEGEKDDTIESPIVMQNQHLFTSFDDTNSLEQSDDREHAEEAEASAVHEQEEVEEVEQEAEEEEESEDAKVARELAESEALAWQMMQEESQHAYDMQMQYMQEHANNMSAEDYAAMQMAMNEGQAQPTLQMPANNNRRRNRRANSQGTEGSSQDTDGTQEGHEGEEEEGEEGSEGEEEEESIDEDEAWQDPNNYEHLLALSNQIGDVKTERWRLKAPQVIAALPRVTYAQILTVSQGGQSTKSDDSSSGKTDSDTLEKDTESTKTCLSLHALQDRKLCFREIDAKCAVCMGEFCSETSEGEEEEELALLPCDHFFHAECVEGWMKDNNSCPHCLQEVES